MRSFHIGLIMIPVSYKHNTAVKERPWGDVLELNLTAAGRIESPTSIAQTLVSARQKAIALPGFPGTGPLDLGTSYSIQEAALGLYPSAPIGWKVGIIHPSLRAILGSDRLSGPIFADGLIDLRDGGNVRRKTFQLNAPMYAGGSAAVEAEFIAELCQDAPDDQLEWTLEDAARMIGALYVGVELAGSPVPHINGLGPCCVTADFGNNAGLILGPAIADWREHRFEEYQTRTMVEGIEVGTGSAQSVPGSPVESVRFLLGHLAKRGRPMRKGALISTGATTGVHDVVQGQTAHISFTGIADFFLSITPRAAQISDTNHDE
jgi:2-keto-4-pentenoate hydratase